MLKKCFKCGVEKSIDEYYAHPKMADGHLGKCKECAKKDVLLRSILKREYIRNYEKKRGKTEKRKLYTKKHTSEWRLKNPEKYLAHNVVNNAIRDGKIIKPALCEICGEKAKLHGHHYDYSKPMEVVWLCP